AEIEPPRRPSDQPGPCQGSTTEPPRPTPNVTDSQPPTERMMKRKAASQAHARQNKKKKEEKKKEARHLADGVYSNPPPREKANNKYFAMAKPILTNVKVSAADVTSTGFTGMRNPKAELKGVGYEGTQRMLKDKRVYTLDELVGDGSVFGFQHIKWDGKTPRPLVDVDGLLFGVAGGQPNDANWNKQQLGGAKKLSEARETSSNANSDQTPRRGDFKTMRCGISHGGGQTRPMNLKNTGRNLKTIERLNGDLFFRTLAGFTSSVFQHWVPKLHQHYNEELRKLFKHDSSLKPTFETVFTATTYNLGPQTLCLPHIDFANLAYGWCSVTALGNFKHETGGQLILWECGLVIDFPPGSTILFTSALIHHSNTAIGDGEERYSFTQYTAGALFRWVAHGFQKVEEYRKSLESEELAALDKLNSERWGRGLLL
ncbi:hypothetical protein CPB83DRAFT_739202, partial [Crepidotus variabilis]